MSKSVQLNLFLFALSFTWKYKKHAKPYKEIWGQSLISESLKGKKVETEKERVNWKKDV